MKAAALAQDNHADRRPLGGRNRLLRGEFAIGLFLGICIVLVTLLLIQMQTLSPQQACAEARGQHPTAGDQQTAGDCDDAPQFWVYDGAIATRDTLAQWSMVLLAAGGLLTSIWAIFYVKQTLDVSLHALQTTREMALDARDIGVAQTRPYVTVLEIHFLRAEGSDTKCAIAVEIQNCGSTPAMAVEINSLVAIGESRGFGTELPIRPALAQPSQAIIGPGQRFTTQTQITVEPAVQPMLSAGTFSIFAYGEITYLDGFGARHTTRYQQVRGPRSDQNGTAFVACERGNSYT